MKEKNIKETGGCIGSIIWMVQLVFLVLKLSGTIDWSWWWVLSPLLGAAALGIISFCGLRIIDFFENALW